MRESSSSTKHIIEANYTTSHCCPRFAAGDVLGIGKILGNMAHMSNIFSHRLATKGWSIWYIKWENMGRKGNMVFSLQGCKRT